MKIRVVLFSIVFSTACGGGDDFAPAAGPQSATAGEAVATYARVVLASYEDAHSGALALDVAVDALLTAPTTAGLEQARQAWREAREPYLQTEAYRFYDGPIDDPDTGVEGFVNAWPLDEHYIDYVEGDPDSGIINDPSIEISAQTLLGSNEAGGEKNIATGFHAIEFLLWGQDLDADGPGARPHTDFIDRGTADNQDRRREYLATVSDLLVGHLQDMVDAWAESEDNYRAELEGLEPNAALERILTGIIVLTGFETGGERLQTALDTGDQEDEHSCFSDNTHRDMVQDVRGIQNVYRGRYERPDGSIVSGTGLADVVRGVDEALAAQVDEQIGESLALAEALVPPFDREVSLTNDAGRQRITDLVDSLSMLEDVLKDVFLAFDLTVELPE